MQYRTLAAPTRLNEHTSIAAGPRLTYAQETVMLHLTFRRPAVLLMSLGCCATFVTRAAHAAPQCVDLANPKCEPIHDAAGNPLELTGDYELLVDPAAPTHLLLVNETGSSCTTATPVWPVTQYNVDLFQIDTSDGVTVTASNRPWVSDYSGCSGLNGAEFLIPSGGALDLAILYRGVDNLGNVGVYGRFRASGASWNAFTKTYAGAPILGAPMLPTKKR